MSSPQIDVILRLKGIISGAIDFGQLQHTLDWPPTQPWTQFLPGTSSGQIDTVFTDLRTIAASGTDNLDLNGALTDSFGASVALLHVNLIAFYAAAANTNNVTIGAGTNPFVGPLGGTTPTLTLNPGGLLLVTHPGAGWAVTAATADILKVINSSSGTSVDYGVVIAGRST